MARGTDESDEHNVGTAEGVKQYTSIRRPPIESRYQKEVLETMRGLPWDLKGKAQEDVKVPAATLSVQAQGTKELLPKGIVPKHRAVHVFWKESGKVTVTTAVKLLPLVLENLVELEKHYLAYVSTG